MRRRSVVLICAAFLSAAPAAAQDAKATPIAPENVGRLRLLTETRKHRDQILRGTGPGEMILIDTFNAFTVEVVDAATLRTLRTLPELHWPLVRADGKLLSWIHRPGNEATYAVHDADGAELFKVKFDELPDHEILGGPLAASANGKLFAIGVGHSRRKAAGAGHSEVSLFDAKGRLVRTLEKGDSPLVQPYFSPDGKLLVVQSDTIARVYDAATGKRLYGLTGGFEFSPDSKTLAASSVEERRFHVQLRSAATGELLRSAATDMPVFALDWSPKGDLLAVASKGKIALLEAATLKKVKELDVPDLVGQVRFSSDGARLLSASMATKEDTKENRVTVWSVDGAK